jgi:hypothetical protein
MIANRPKRMIVDEKSQTENVSAHPGFVMCPGFGIADGGMLAAAAIYQWAYQQACLQVRASKLPRKWPPELHLN